MKHHIQMPNFDDNHLRYTAKAVVKFAGHHKNSILAGIAGLLFLDNIRGRIGRKKDRVEYQKRDLKHQEIERKHEAQIMACMERAEQCQKAVGRMVQLDHIVQNLTAKRSDPE